MQWLVQRRHVYIVLKILSRGIAARLVKAFIFLNIFDYILNLSLKQFTGCFFMTLNAPPLAKWQIGSWMIVLFVKFGIS